MVYVLILKVHAAALAAYGITSEFIAETQVLINAMNEMLLKPRMAIIFQKGAYQKCERATRTYRQLIEGTIGHVGPHLQDEFTWGFFNQYQSARMIIGNGHKTPPQPDDGGSV